MAMMSPNINGSTRPRSRSQSPNSQRIASAMIYNSISASQSPNTTPLKIRAFSRSFDERDNVAGSKIIVNNVAEVSVKPEESAPVAVPEKLASPVVPSSIVEPDTKDKDSATINPILVSLSALSNSMEALLLKQTALEQSVLSRLQQIEQRVSTLEQNTGRARSPDIKGESMNITSSPTPSTIGNQLSDRLTAQLQGNTLKGIDNNDNGVGLGLSVKEKMVVDELVQRLETIEDLMKPPSTNKSINTPQKLNNSLSSFKKLEEDDDDVLSVSRKSTRQANLDKLRGSRQQGLGLEDLATENEFGQGYEGADSNASIASLYSLPPTTSYPKTSNNNTRSSLGEANSSPSTVVKQYLQDLLGQGGGRSNGNVDDEELQALFQQANVEEESEVLEQSNSTRDLANTALPSLPLTTNPTLTNPNSPPVNKASNIPPPIFPSSNVVQGEDEDALHKHFNNPDDPYLMPEYEYDT